ncbi:MAG TPA: sulfatase [Planctomycetaceae bacterium]|nr:sulfatase [Planctomycetaceae bacterium]
MCFRRPSTCLRPLVFLGLVAFVASLTFADDNPQRPNILFVLADDHTTQAISCYGGMLAKYARTTNIDRLAREGVRLTHCFCNNSICTPSRASILTGQYSHRNGVFLLDQPLKKNASTFPKLLARAGYQTGVFGKWHLVNRPEGFDTYQVLPRQGRYQNPQFLVPDTDDLVEVEGWSTDVIADLTMDFIRNRDTERPFLAMCHFKATHDPWDSREPHKSLWLNEEIPEPENLYDDYSGAGAASKRTTLKLEQINQGTFAHTRREGVDIQTQRSHIYQQYIKAFLRCGRVLDENVGRLLEFLEAEGLSKNTIVIYTADQGHFLGEHGFFSKRFMYEESLRMPFIIRYPEVLPAGQVCDSMISNVDFAKTILESAGIEPAEEMQGRSFWANLHGQNPTDWPNAIYYRYWQHRLHRNVTAHYGIRTRNEKLIYFYGESYGLTDFESTPPEWEYYDLAQDPHEMNNAIDDPTKQNRIESLKQQLKQLKAEVGDLK